MRLRRRVPGHKGYGLLSYGLLSVISGALALRHAGAPVHGGRRPYEPWPIIVTTETIYTLIAQLSCD